MLQSGTRGAYSSFKFSITREDQEECSLSASNVSHRGLGDGDESRFMPTAFLSPYAFAGRNSLCSVSGKYLFSTVIF